MICHDNQDNHGDIATWWGRQGLYLVGPMIKASGIVPGRSNEKSRSCQGKGCSYGVCQEWSPRVSFILKVGSEAQRWVLTFAVKLSSELIGMSSDVPQVSAIKLNTSWGCLCVFSWDVMQCRVVLHVACQLDDAEDQEGSNFFFILLRLAAVLSL